MTAAAPGAGAVVAAGAGAGPLTTAATVALGTLRKFSRSPRIIVSTVGLPIVMMLLLAALIGKVAMRPGQGDYIDRLLPLILLIAASFGTMPSAASFRRDVDTGLVARLRTLPVSRAGLLAGRAVADALRAMAVAPVITLVAVLLGFRFEEGALAAVGFFLVVGACGATFGWVAVAVALRTKNPEAMAGGLDPVLQILTFLCTGLVPVDAFPRLLHRFVEVNPFSRAVELLMALSSGGDLAGPLLQTASWVVGVGGLAAFLAVRAIEPATARPAG